MRKIKLECEQVRALLVDGECSIVGNMYEVSQMDGLCVRVDADGVLRKVDMPRERKGRVGRPSKTRIRSTASEGIFVDKEGKFVVGDEVDVVDGRRVEITSVKVKRAKDISNHEWNAMGVYWNVDYVANDSKCLHLGVSSLDKANDVCMYWYKEV